MDNTVTAPAPALGYSLVANLGDNRQMTVQCFVASDAPLAEQHAAVDKAMAVVDRQRAKYEINDLLTEREKHSQALDRAEEDLARLDLDYKTGLTAEQAHLADLAEEVAKINRDAADRGRAKPVGNDGARRDAIFAMQKETAANREKMEAERRQALVNYGASVERFKKAISDLDTRISAARALVDASGG